MNLNVDTPDDVVEVLRDAAVAYYDFAEKLEASWQDSETGKIWEYIAKEFEKLANKIEERI